MKTQHALITAIVMSFLTTQPIQADEPSAFGSGFDVQDFYRGFTLDEITPQNQQKWPYYRYVSAHWDKYSGHGVAEIKPSNPAKLTAAGKGERFDMNTDYDDGKSFIESMQSTQVKGFVAMKDNEILAEFYDNGFNVTDTNLLQSASKTYAAILVHELVDAGKINLDAKVENILSDFKGSSMGAATVQQVLDHTSGMPQLLDFHTPGALGQLWEIEIGLQGGKPRGHSAIITEDQGDPKAGRSLAVQ